MRWHETLALFSPLDFAAVLVTLAGVGRREFAAQSRLALPDRSDRAADTQT